MNAVVRTQAVQIP